MKEVLSDFLEEIYLSLKYSLRDITLFPGDNLIDALKITAGITAVSGLCALLGLPKFVDWRGALLGTIILALLIFIGRRRDSETSGENGTCNDGIGLYASGEESSSTEGETQGRKADSIDTSSGDEG